MMPGLAEVVRRATLTSALWYQGLGDNFGGSARIHPELPLLGAYAIKHMSMERSLHNYGGEAT